MTDERAAEDKVGVALPVQRLCNEIQLFDLCELERCSFKQGRYCANAELLTVFEKISDAEVHRPEMLISEGLEEGDDPCDEEYDGAFEDDEFGNEEGYEEE
ncbi:MAG: hypothetical protein M0T70_08430 [Geobacteraceae bacterium]|nr:hypothetical protein [Geobacteraceae bacterium]